MNPEAHAHLKRTCKVMARLIREHGPCTIAPEKGLSPFKSLVTAVANQQLHNAAAATILRRFCELFPGKRFPSPAALASVTDDAIRACGFSRAKVAAIRDIAAKALDGTIPSSQKIVTLTDDEIIERLTKVRGVGRWTVEMMLIFKLGRPNVLPVDDFGVRTGYRVAYQLTEMPKPKELLAYGEPWRPHATTAAWYLWQAANTAKNEKPAKGVNA